MRTICLFIFAALLLVRADTGWCNDLPKDVSKGLTAAHAWLNDLNSLTLDEIKKRLGDGGKTTTWSFQGKDEPMMEFEMDDEKYSLLLYFYNRKVIKSSLQVLSD